MLNKNNIVVALAKGRLAEKTVEYLVEAGYDCKDILLPSRKLIFNLEDLGFSFMFVKPSDVPIYVESGVCDIGVCGRDTILEEDRDVYELLDLEFGKCKLCIAGYKDTKTDDKLETLKVATKYKNIALKVFADRGQNVELIKLNGSIEIAPIIGLSDVIFDVVESGKTLKENNLVVLEEIYDISAHLISNKVSLKSKKEIIEIVDKLQKVVESKRK